MTGYAQVRGQVNAGLAFTLGLKSVNHRFLDLHFRLPSDTDSLEMKLRRLLKEKMARGHVEITLSMEYAGSNGVALNTGWWEAICRRSGRQPTNSASAVNPT